MSNTISGDGNSPENVKKVKNLNEFLKANPEAKNAKQIISIFNELNAQDDGVLSEEEGEIFVYDSGEVTARKNGKTVASFSASGNRYEYDENGNPHYVVPPKAVVLSTKFKNTKVAQYDEAGNLFTTFKPGDSFVGTLMRLGLDYSDPEIKKAMEEANQEAAKRGKFVREDNGGGFLQVKIPKEVLEKYDVKNRANSIELHKKSQAKQTDEAKPAEDKKADTIKAEAAVKKNNPYQVAFDLTKKVVVPELEKAKAQKEQEAQKARDDANKAFANKMQSEWSEYEIEFASPESVEKDNRPSAFTEENVQTPPPVDPKRIKSQKTEDIVSPIKDPKLLKNKIKTKTDKTEQEKLEAQKKAEAERLEAQKKADENKDTDATTFNSSSETKISVSNNRFRGEKTENSEIKQQADGTFLQMKTGNLGLDTVPVPLWNRYDKDGKTPISTQSVKQYGGVSVVETKNYVNGKLKNKSISMDQYEKRSKSSLGMNTVLLLSNDMPRQKCRYTVVKDSNGNEILRYENGSFRNQKGKEINKDKAISILEKYQKTGGLTYTIEY